MNDQSVGVVFAIAIFQTASLPARAMPQTTSPEQQVREVVTHLVGIMDTSAQAAENPEAPNVRMTTCRVRVDSTDARSRPSVFLYQEQALSHRLDSPRRRSGSPSLSRMGRNDRPTAVIGHQSLVISNFGYSPVKPENELYPTNDEGRRTNDTCIPRLSVVGMS